MAPICGIDAQTIREVARLYATSKASIILWGMGISQHVHGTDNARCLIALALSTGQIGKPGSGLHPLRGQNNVQGASDSGLIPMFYPDYQRVNVPEARQRFEALWQMPLDPDPGLTVVEIMNAAKKHEIRGMYIMGENPAMSDPDVDHAREAMAALDHCVVQDIFLTETAYLADVVLPATAWPEKVGTVTNTDRMVQLGRKAIDAPGEARPDFDLLVELGQRMGLDWQYAHPRDVFNEMRLCMDSIAGITWERLEGESSVTYPCVKEGDPGDPVVFIENFPTPSGRAKFVPADLISAAERPDAEYPLVLITGRQLEHWHTGSMTRRASNLDYIEPEPVASVHPLDLETLGIAPGGTLTIESRRGSISLVCARRRRHAARCRVRPVLLLRGGRQHADQPGAGSVRQDPGVQVLRDQGDGGRSRSRPFQFRGWTDSGRGNGTPLDRGRAGGLLQASGSRSSVYSPDYEPTSRTRRADAAASCDARRCATRSSGSMLCCVRSKPNPFP